MAIEQTEPAPSPGILAGAVGLAAAFLYAPRLCPDLCLVGDSAELVTAAALWGVPHAPGYPLYTLLAHACTWLPMGTMPWRVHLTSALFHGAAVAFTARAAFSITGSRAAALAAGIALATARSFFLGSLYAEVFPLNDLFFAALLATALWLRRVEEAQDRRAALAFACLAGAASAHHMMIALAAPALLVLVARPCATWLRRRPRLAAEATAAFLAPVILSFALIPVAAARGPELSWGDVHDAGSLLRLVTRADYGGLWAAARHASTAPGWVRLGSFGALIMQSFGVPTLLAALWGLSALLSGAPSVGAALALAVLVPGPLFAWANALETGTPETLAYFERFTTMAHVPIAVLLGAGVAEAWRALQSSRGQRIAAGIALAAWAVYGAERARDVSLHDDRLGAAFGRDLIDPTPDGSLILLTGDAPANAALYVCAVEHRCGDRIVLSPGALSLPWRMTQVRRRYPQLAIPWSDGPALARSHEIVAAEESRRPTFVYPDLATKDPALIRAPFLAVPAGLLLRVGSIETDEGALAAAFQASARAMADAGCEGCRLLASAPAPPAEAIASRAYEVAYENHAAVARALSRDADASLEGVARSLDERAARTHEAIRGHGAGSISR